MKPEASQLPEEFEQYQEEINLLLHADFSQGNGARWRVKQKLEERRMALPWWQMLWRGISELQVRLALASSMLLLFVVLNLEGLFALPQQTSNFTPVPIMAAVQMVRLTDVISSGTLRPNTSSAKVTPQIVPYEAILLPTPVPVPVPLVEQ